MESNKDEARKARDIAEKKISENDYVGAKRFVIKAQNLHPKLDGLEKMSMTIHVLISASNKINGGRGETDWYGVLCVDPSADDEEVKKQYKKLALLVHPDKNKFNGAEEAFKLIQNALSVLSCKVMRTAFDHKRKSREVKQKDSWKKQKTPSKTQEPDSSAEESVDRRKYKRKPKNDYTFWTMCNVCKTYCMLERFNNLNKTMSCPNCYRGYVAKEIIPEMDVDGRPVFRFSPEQHSSAKYQERSERTSDTSSSSSTSASDSAKAANEANSTHGAEERLSKKPVKVNIFEE